MGHFEGKEGRDKGRTLIFYLRGKEGEWKKEEDLARAVLVRGVQQRKAHLRMLRSYFSGRKILSKDSSFAFVSQI